MKYKLYGLLPILLGYSTLYPLDNYTNKTYMFVRPIFDSVCVQQASWHNFVYNKQKRGAACQLTMMYEQTFPNSYGSSYFFFDEKNILSISAGTASKYEISGSGQFNAVKNPQDQQMGVKSLNRDILGQWIGINQGNDFTIQLNPESRQTCAILEISQDLKTLFSWSMFENWFVNISAPLSFVENNINATGDAKALAAFHQSGWQYANIVSGDRSIMSIPQATISLGTKYMSENLIQIITSSGVIIPLVEQPCNGSLFAPMPGFNSHFGFDTQVHFQFPIVRKTPDAASAIVMFVDIHNNFLSRNHQLRTYDIRHKPFSRYMMLLDRKTNQIIPAMNALTIRTRVEPFNVVNFATGFRFIHHSCTGEIGYELWAHGSEVATPQPLTTHEHDSQIPGLWEEDRYGIAFINKDGALAKINPTTGDVEPIDIAAQEPGQTASNSTINFVAAPDGQLACCPNATFLQKNKYLTLRDLDRQSCIARSAITHKAFLTVGLAQKGKTRDYFTNFGAFIEASQNNAALCFWGGWLKAGFSF